MLVEGHHFGRVAEQPQWLVVVIGIWVVFGLMATVGATVLGISWNMGDRLGVLTGIGLLLFSVVLIAKTTRNYIKQQAAKGEDKDR